MKHAHAVRRACTAGFLTIVAFLPLCGCAAMHVAEQPIQISAPFLRAALTDDLDDEGKFVAYLSDGRTLEGRWKLVTRRDSPPIAIQTPRGRITTADLAIPHHPRFTGKVNGPGSSVRMICAFVGDSYSGYRIRCVENTGTEWSGTFADRKWLGEGSGSFTAVNVSLHEVARCPPCDDEVAPPAGKR